MNTAVILMLVAGAWIGFIWYVKSFSKKYKKTFGNQQPKQPLGNNYEMFKNDGIRSSLDIGDRFHIDSI